jgi:4-hydroxybenzoate polyprenyltransferase
LLKYLLISIRPKQWYKNSLLFVGIVFSANLLDASMWGTVVLAFIYFCMLSSAEYLINDICDRERDRIHPLKSQRPIASGRLDVRYALLFALLLIGFSLLGAYLTINLNFLIISASYLLLILLYSLVLKRLIIADVLVISTGFVIRAIAGALAIDVAVSLWLIICTLLLALFLALEKRWHELSTLAGNAAEHRLTLSRYSPKMLERMIGITTGALIVSYVLYTFFARSVAMPLTVPFAIYGLIRYIYLAHQKGLGGELEVIFKDKAMLLNLGIWGLLVVSIMLYETLA